MTQAHDPIATLAEQIAAAPFAPETWPSVLGEIARITGGRGGQLIAAEPARFLFLLASEDVSQDMLHRLDADGGADPTRNPRAAVAFAA